MLLCFYASMLLCFYALCLRLCYSAAVLRTILAFSLLSFACGGGDGPATVDSGAQGSSDAAVSIDAGSTGGPCGFETNAAACQDGSYCKEEGADTCTGECTEYKQLGETWASGDRCAPGTFANTVALECQSLRGSSQSCDATTGGPTSCNPASHVCDQRNSPNMCVPFRNEGQACDNADAKYCALDLICQSGECITPGIPEGDVCFLPTACQEGFYCLPTTFNGNGIPTSGECTTQKDVGGSCVPMGNECLSHSCVSNVCTSANVCDNL